MTQTPSFCDIQLNDRVLVVLPVEKDARFETYANVPFNSVIKIGKDIDAMAQVSIILTYLPALQILQSLPYKVKNKKVILNGGIGPVNRSLIHLCMIHGAKKIYVPCMKKHRETVRSIGGRTVGPQHHDWGPSYIGEIDLMVDAIGENSYVTSKAVLNEKGHLCVIGNTDSALKDKSMFNSLNKMILDYRVHQSTRTTVFSLMASLQKDRESFIQDFEYLTQLMEEERLEPMFTRVSLDEYRDSERTNATMLNAPIICDPWSEYKWG
jgi:NADPH:quinone reductase-like Zn-dependent oxidoreductase